MNQVIHWQAMAVHDVKQQAELPKAVAMHCATLATAYLCLEVMKTSKETLKHRAKAMNELFCS